MNKMTLRREAEDTIRKHTGKSLSLESARLSHFAAGVIALLDEVEETQRAMRELEGLMRQKADPKVIADFLRDTRYAREGSTAEPNRG